ncbi:hypothetical protein ACLF3G_03975 [Falsiroseomonas sp. HC035]|uniref:hypothetical protein n=1 Tax=Falsiroseomonas sp. HC035 TaxID=3390999 RepID=UPI003D317D71
MSDLPCGPGRDPEVSSMHDLIAFLVSLFLLNPLQAEMQSRLAEASAPPAVMAGVAACAVSAGPALVQRAMAEPMWAISTAFQSWIGTVEPQAVLGQAAPDCVPAMAAARPYLLRS